jgi:predicted HicB family RNase H-like nuclease
MTTTSKKRVTLFLDPNLLKHAKAQAAVEEISLATLIERDLIKYLPKETRTKRSKIDTEG